MNIGIIGSGAMGTCLASKFSRCGHKVSIANSRGPASLQQFAAEIGATAATAEETIKDQELIIIAVPQKSVPHLPVQLFKELPADVIVIDLGNYYPALRDGIIPELEQTWIDSLWVQEQLGIPVVKVFNSISAASLENLGKAKGGNDRVALAVSGDNTKAKEVVFKLVDEIGFDTFDTGSIPQSWKQQPGSTIYCRDISLKEIKRRVEAMGPEWTVERNEILAKRKADEILMAADYPAYLESLREGKL